MPGHRPSGPGKAEFLAFAFISFAWAGPTKGECEMKKEKSSKPKAKPQQAASFEQLINPPLDKFKDEIQYDAGAWLAEREADENLKKPFDLMITFALVCARQVTAILISLSNLKNLCVSGKALFPERWRLCSGLYVLSAVNQRLRNLPDDEWKQWPVTRGSHCFEINGLSTLLALDAVCTGVEDFAFGCIFRWIWSVSGRRVDCDPVLSVIEDAVGDAGILNFIEWSHRFNLNLFMYSDLFPWSGDVRFHDEMISDECDPEEERERVILELEFEHREAVANLKKTELSKPAVSSGEADLENKDLPKLPGRSTALILLKEHPDWKDNRIAKEAGVNRSSLYRWPEYKLLRQLLLKERSLPRGSKNKDGSIEAIAEE